MRSCHAFALFLMAAVGVVGAHPALADAPTPGFASQGWGPSWVGGGPPGGLSRPEKFDAPVTRAALRDDQSDIGVGVRMWCDADVITGHQYQLVYQLRIQTRKGDFGPLLGDTSHPEGTTYLIASGTADSKWNGLEGSADITRKDLSAMTKLPKDGSVILRIEPQLLDVTTNKYVTAPKTDALIVVANVGPNGQVYSVTSLPRYIMGNGQYSTQRVLDLLSDMDTYDAEGNRIGEAMGAVLSQKDISSAMRVNLLHAVSKSWVHMKSPELWGAVNTLATSDDPNVSAAAKELLK